MGTGLALADRLPEDAFEMNDIIVLEGTECSTTETKSDTNRRVIVLVRDDKATFADESGEGSRVGGETHRSNDRIFLSNKTGYESLGLEMEIRSPTFRPRAK